MRVMTGFTDYTLCSNGKKFRFRVSVETEGNDLQSISRKDFQEILCRTADTGKDILDGEIEEEVED